MTNSVTFYETINEKDLQKASKQMKAYLEDQEIDLPDAKLPHSGDSEEG
jgi:hypothetical protein